MKPTTPFNRGHRWPSGRIRPKPPHSSWLDKKAALWHDTGTGKTRTAIEIADPIGANFILVICPVIALEHWKAQFAEHGRSIAPSRSCVARRAPAQSNVIVVPFSLISKYPRLAERLRQYDFDLMVIDEAHALMTMDSNRTRSIYAIGSGAAACRTARLMSCSCRRRCRPTAARTSCTPHLRALRPDLLGPAQGYDTFVDRYCEPRFGRGGSSDRRPEQAPRRN